MLKKIGLKVLIAAMIVVSLSSDSLAQTRIRFARGRSAATVGGVVGAGGARAFVLNVGRGQTMTVQVTSGNNRIELDVDGPDGHIEYGDNGYSQVYIDRGGDHTITISNSGRAATKFSLTVTVR
jgi:hypothetical protein